jgi:hypothetical protein
MNARVVTMVAAIFVATPALAQPAVRPLDAAQPTPGLCVYRDAAYSAGATLCVTPTIRLTCQLDTRWTETSDAGACETFSRGPEHGGP